MTSPRSLTALPKTHLHLHFTGSMRFDTLLDLAAKHGIRLPRALTNNWPPQLADTEGRGWFRFQRLYEAARACITTESDIRRVLHEAAEDDAAEGSRRLELQVDPTGYATHLGGITPALEIILDEARKAHTELGIEIGVIVAASRTRHPLDARALARLAARYAGDGPGQVIGFGLSNDERRGETSEFAPAFRIAARAGLTLVPHGGELLGPDHLAHILDSLHPHRFGHGVRAAEDPHLLQRAIDKGVGFEICPGSNVALGVYNNTAALPLRTLYEAGAHIALGADDPLLFGSRLAAQYEIARNHHGFTDKELAELARRSVYASTASTSSKTRMLTDIDNWINTPAEIP
ncbi:adenosine deaminase [Dermatophilus congolensis]|uniref:adenosine deaminase n=1 Tax=Dermatophilus congolensis TaxID=1863 RepID=UPI001AAE202E|nr:adenosine deaminase [Dermatophilus congolensis]MBO3152182.1 adenosine deaminase [Dermatophilus congolensis]MBO3160805.1 adenosine deaminase [Dermatophilus congolensis]MBO3163470.1 adenosine deaminase [Dermatophilus congolensis]MBO3177020.1 adenosine deaminase [Dermatophilus congolensis]